MFTKIESVTTTGYTEIRRSKNANEGNHISNNLLGLYNLCVYVSVKKNETNVVDCLGNVKFRSRFTN